MDGADQVADDDFSAHEVTKVFRDLCVHAYVGMLGVLGAGCERLGSWAEGRPCHEVDLAANSCMCVH